MIRGKKNYLPPQPLVFGFGFMFKVGGDFVLWRVYFLPLESSHVHCRYEAGSDFF
jgi:hypothetical protein